MFYPYPPHQRKKKPEMQAQYANWRIIEACDRVIHAYETALQERIDKAVADQMAPLGWFKSLFYKPAATREEALDRLKNTYDCGVSVIKWMEWEGSLWFDKARKLKHMAETTDGAFIVIDENSSWILTWVYEL